jgi:tRNA A-37 threonylcarbamoyl transferase component Bud32
MHESPTDLAAIERELREALAPHIQITRLIGRGAMGAVFLARDPALKRDVVVKVLAPELAHDDIARKRFAREAETAAAVSHPNIVEIFHVGELPVSGTGYFVMRHVNGPTLADACPLGTQLPQARCRRIIGEVASALAAAHARGLVHRDIKPTNIMLDGQAERVVVLDFGISAAATPEHPTTDQRLTSQGTSVGTPAYMSPEQAAGDDVTDRSDVYSLGVMAFELLAGRAPFEATSPMALIAAHIKDVPPPIATLRPDLDPSFASLIDRMLAKAPRQRPSAEEVARTLLPGAHVIEWPPPGLESMRGTALLGLNFFVLAAVALPFRIIMASPAFDAGRFFASALFAFAAIVLMCVASVMLGIASKQARVAHRQGYPMSVSIDVLLDRAPDTAALLNGTGPYASLPAGTAGRWLHLRRYAAGALFTGAAFGVLSSSLWSMGILDFADVRAAESVTFAGFAAMILPPLVGLLISAIVRFPEIAFRRRNATSERISARKRPPIPRELVHTWLGTSGKTAPSSSPRRGNALVLAGEWTVAILVLLVMANLVSSSISSVIGSMSSATGSPTRYQHARLHKAISEAAGAPSIESTLQAYGPGATTQSIDTAALRAVAESRDAAGIDPAIVWRAFAILPATLPADVSLTLDTATRHPALEPMRRIARGAQPPPFWFARAVNLATDRMRDSRVADPLVRIATRNLAASALALSRGSKAEAIARARENVAIGRILAGEPLTVGYLRGIGLASNAARALQEIGIATSDRSLIREGQALAVAIADARERESLFSPQTLGRLASRPDDTLLVSLTGNRALLPVNRWDAAGAIAHGSCWNEAELRAGVSPVRRQQIDDAERRLADIPKSAEWIALQREFLASLEHANTPPSSRDHQLPPLISRLRPAARAIICGMR